MNSEPAERTTPTSRRHLGQFSLGTTFVIVTLLCVGAAIIRWQTYQATWRDMGATVNMNAASAPGVTKLDLTLANADMLPANIGNLKNLRELRIREPQFRSFYRDIGKLTMLEYVKVEYELRDGGGGNACVTERRSKRRCLLSAG